MKSMTCIIVHSLVKHAYDVKETGYHNECRPKRDCKMQKLGTTEKHATFKENSIQDRGEYKSDQHEK